MNSEAIIEQISELTNILKETGNDYVHQENTYENFHQIIEGVKAYAENFDDNLRSFESAILFLGMTGWGKSTAINYLEGIELQSDAGRNLIPIDSNKVKTKIGDGSGSTTMIPIACSTSFGNVYDLPGDYETRGVGIELLNGIFKREITKNLKRAKLIFVIPAFIFSAQGSYGSDFKDLLQANDRFLGGLNNYKDNIMFIISHAGRREDSLKNVTDQIKTCLSHGDKLLKPYEDLINHVINKKRVKLFAKPSDDQQTKYSLPKSQNWVTHKKENIIKAINNIPFADSKNEFSVPFNIKLVQFLTKLIEILAVKAMNEFQKSFSQINISGIQLKSLIDTLNNLNDPQNRSLEQFQKLFSANSYLVSPKIEEINKQIEFINIFIERQSNTTYQRNWITPKLQDNIKIVLNQALALKSKKQEDFKKKCQHNLLKVDPYSTQFNTVEQNMKELENLYQQFNDIKQKKTNEWSEFYEDYQQKVFDKTIQEPYEINQKYIDYEDKTSTIEVPTIQYYNEPITRSRVAYRNQTQYYTEQEQRNRLVTRYRTQQVEVYTGGRRYGLFGPKNKEFVNVRVPYKVNRIYYVDVQKSRVVSRPYQQYYTDYVQRSRVVYKYQTRTKTVAVEKTRKKTMYRNKDIYKNVTKRRLMTEKYDQQYNKVDKQINNKAQQIQNILKAVPKSNLTGEIRDIEETINPIFNVDQYKNLLKMWKESEHHAFHLKYNGVRKILA